MSKFIYLIKNLEEGYCKVGVAKQPQKRLQQLQTGNSAELTVLYTYESEYANKIEKTLHNQYSFLKKEGEWFDFSIKQEQDFLMNCQRIEKTIKFLTEKNNPFI